MMIDNRLTQEALALLNKHRQHKYTSTTKHDAEIQNAYYAGMKDMLSMILTDNYRQDATIVYSDTIKSHIFVQVDQAENYSGDNEISIEIKY